MDPQFLLRVGGAALHPHALHPHDCDRCRLLGVMFKTAEGDPARIARTYDVYHCSDEPIHGSLLLRFGSDECYDSFPLNIARRVAEEDPSGRWASALQLFQLSRQREC